MTVIPADYRIRRCLRICTDCSDTCLRIAVNAYFVERISERELKLLLQCAKLCRKTADGLTAGALPQSRLWKLCADVCESCAGICERSGIEAMRRCAEVCRRCAESCRELAAETKGP
jgi:hypothetical protein